MGISTPDSVESGTDLPLAEPQKNDKAKHGRRLSRVEINAILSLAEANRPVSAICREIGCSDDTVYNVLHDFQDARSLARKRLKAGSLELAERVLAKAKPKECVRVLEDLRVLTPPQQGPQSVQQNVIVLGARTAPGDILASLSPHTITVQSEDTQKA